MLGWHVRWFATAAAVMALTATFGLGAAASADSAGGESRSDQRAHHVLLLSVDGLHQSDLTWYVSHHPDSAWARLAGRGVSFTNAFTPVPSDSFPGLVAQVTGGNPSSTGIFYDDSYNHALLPAGTTATQCASAKPGAEVTYFEQLDKNLHSIDAGQGISGLPDNILAMTGNPNQVIDPTQLPVDPASCQPVFPHSYLKVNTIFEVARAQGLRTAWVDKHPAYEIVNGPSGTGVQDLFTPEINSDAPTLGSPTDWTAVNTLTQQYDSYKAQAVVNEINGFDHSGTKKVGAPAIFGMNFQSVSTAQKLPTSVTATSGSTKLPGGYESDGVTPGPVLRGALDYINSQIAKFTAALDAAGLSRDTAIILSAKHGQSPQNPAQLTRIDDGAIISALNAQWAVTHPQADPLVAFSISDDGMLIWLSDRSTQATAFAKQFLLGFNGTGNDINGSPKPFTRSGLTQVLAGRDAADFFRIQPGDPRAPDLVGFAQVGTVYTAKKGKIAEHGGVNPLDRHVPLIVAGAAVSGHRTSDRVVETTQIAPTILRLLGLEPDYLQAVQIEHTPTLNIG